MMSQFTFAISSLTENGTKENLHLFGILYLFLPDGINSLETVSLNAYMLSLAQSSLNVNFSLLARLDPQKLFRHLHKYPERGSQQIPSDGTWFLCLDKQTT